MKIRDREKDLPVYGLSTYIRIAIKLLFVVTLDFLPSPFSFFSSPEAYNNNFLNPSLQLKIRSSQSIAEPPKPLFSFLPQKYRSRSRSCPHNEAG